MTSHADPSMLPTRSVLTLCDSDGSRPASRSTMICDYCSCAVIVIKSTFLVGDGLTDNQISSLPKTLFTPTLTCLLLAHNLLTDISDGLITLSNLQTLDVSFDSLAIIQPSISQLASLVKVNFGFNKIKEVPNELFRIPTLTHLILSHNKLTSLPTDPAMSPNCDLSLGFVDPLRNSMIYEKTGTGTHPGAVLCALERLLLASNRLTSVPPLVSQFRQLHTLSLAGNGISELPRHFFRSLPSLSRLDLLFPELTHLPESIKSENTKRISLDVSFNKLTSLPHFLVDTNSSLHSSQLLSLRQRFFGTCPPHSPAPSALISPVTLLLDGSGSRRCGFGGGMEESTIKLKLSELNNTDSSRTMVEQDGNQLKTERADHPHFNQLTWNKNKKNTLLVPTRARTLRRPRIGNCHTAVHRRPKTEKDALSDIAVGVEDRRTALRSISTWSRLTFKLSLAH
ncbi:putative leucine-rich repeat protein [Blattamonas nauphoetae]|uniref:Leucine-rich repeat protein n=1 Tax=Blattamonas nauphoetae TaxID=2049346 RepID=A0ABQ9YDJ3_9EUKA|nr:putative leucine-rich repeat protein [Blattamonas nauphoetae]